MSDTELQEQEKLGPEAEQIESGISPGEQAELDQIEAGLQDESLDEPDDEGGLYRPDAKNAPSSRGIGKRKKWLAGGLVGGGIAGVIVAFIFIPILKLNSFLSSIDQRVMAYAVSALEKRAEHMFDVYLIRQVTELQNCGALVATDCRANYGAGIVGPLFTQWRDLRIEARVFDEMGFRLETRANPNPSRGKYMYTLYDRRGRLVTNISNVNEWGEFKRGQFTGGRNDLGSDINRALKKATHWNEVLKRRGVRKYFERKHGVKFFCWFACKARDTAEIKILSAKTRFKLFFVERIVFPFSGKYGFIMNCIVQGGDCKPSDISKERLDRSGIPGEDLQRITDEFKNNPNKKFFSFMFEEMLTKVLSIFAEKEAARAAAQAATKAVPVAGQILLGIFIFDMIYRLDKALEDKVLSKLAADINASQYLEWYAAMQSANDEILAGASGLDEVAALNEQFVGAEESLIYQSTIPERGLVKEGDPDYRCRNDKPIDTAAGELVCPEKKVTRTFLVEEWRENAVYDFLSDNVFGVYEYEVLGCSRCSIKYVVQSALTAVDFVTSSIIGGLLSLIEAIPGLGDIVSRFKAFMEEKMGEFIAWVFDKVFPLPIDIDSPGRDKLDGLEAGGEVTAMRVGQGGYFDDGNPYGLGGVLLSPQQSKAIYDEYQAQLDYEFEKSSLFAKVTDINNPRSVVSSIVRTTPGTPQESVNQFATGLFGVFGIFSNFMPRAYANHNDSLDTSPFGVPRYGYPAGHAALTSDPEATNDEYCRQAKATWEASRTENEDTGFDQYDVANPCLLDALVVESLGAYHTND